MKTTSSLGVILSFLMGEGSGELGRPYPGNKKIMMVSIYFL